MEKQGWKITAIVFIVLFITSIFFIGWAWNIGNEMLVNDYKCSDMCYVNEECVSYLYDEYTNLCYHYSRDLIMIDTIDLG